MPPKGKNRPSEGEQPQEYGQSKDIVRYAARPIPQHLVSSIREYFRTLGADVSTDNPETTNGIFISFKDKSQIHVTGGEFGSAIAVHFITEVPKFAFPSTAIKILKRRCHNISMLGKLGFLDLKRTNIDNYGDQIAMAKDKDVDTTDEQFVMSELERVSKILGHHKRRRSTKKAR